MLRQGCFRTSLAIRTGHKASLSSGTGKFPAHHQKSHSTNSRTHYMDHIQEFLSSTKSSLDASIGRLYPKIILPHVDLHGKRALVTGANIGLGKAIATSFAGQGAEVYLLCRNAQKAEEARKDIVNETGNDNVFVEVVDLASLGSLRDFVERWNQRSGEHRKVDMLVNNAGLTTARKSVSADGFELTYAVNALGPFALTTLLLQGSYLTSNARIISVTSMGMYDGKQASKLPTDLNSPDLLDSLKEGELIHPRDVLKLYKRSKALQVVFTIELQERLKKDQRYHNVVVQSCHPGNVKTSIWARTDGLAADPATAKFLKSMIETLGISCEEGAVTPVWLATSAAAAGLNVQGKYWERNAWKWIPAWMNDVEQRQVVWDLMARDAHLEEVY